MVVGHADMSILHDPARATEDGKRTLDLVRGMRDEFVDFLTTLCRVESPTDHPETQGDVHALIGPAFEELGFDVRIVPGRVSGNHLLAVPKRRRRSAPTQLLMGHSDTVWPLHTLERMPVHTDGGRLYGPGTLDMKGGLTQIIFALRALRDLGVEPSLSPVIFVNADEEVGTTWNRCRSRTRCQAPGASGEPCPRTRALAGPVGPYQDGPKGRGSVRDCRPRPSGTCWA